MEAVPPISAPTEITERALDELPLLYAAAYRRLLAVGYPALESAELREVEIEVDYVGQPLRVDRAHALVVPAADGGAPWAFVGGVWRPVLAVGPELDLVAECEELVVARSHAREAHEQVWPRESSVLDDGVTPDGDAAASAHYHAVLQELDRANEACPWPHVVLPLAHRHRVDLLRHIEYGEFGRPRQMFQSIAVGWARALAMQVESDFVRGRDASARHHASLLRRVFPEDAVGPMKDHMPTTWAVLVDLDRRAARSRRPDGSSTVQSLIERLEDVAVDQPGHDYPHHAMSERWLDEPLFDVIAQDETVRALVAMGSAAADALAHCASSDTRLSRSSRWGLDQGVGLPQPVPVSELCALALYGEDITSWPHAEMTTRDPEVQARDVVAIFERDGAEQERIVSVATWMIDDPDDDGPEPRNLEGMRGHDDDHIARALAGRARGAALARGAAWHEDADHQFCALAIAALLWSEESAMWVVDDAIAAVEDGVHCEEELALALRERRPALVAERASREPWVYLLEVDE